MSLPLQSLVAWAVMNAGRLDEVLQERPLRSEYGVRCITRDLDNGTRQWRFSYEQDHSGLEVIVARFPRGIGFPVHSHPNVEEFAFLSPGVWMYGDPEQSRAVGLGDVIIAESNVPHGWRPTGEEPGLMVVVKRPIDA